MICLERSMKGLGYFLEALLYVDQIVLASLPSNFAILEKRSFEFSCRNFTTASSEPRTSLSKIPTGISMSLLAKMSFVVMASEDSSLRRWDISCILSSLERVPSTEKMLALSGFLFLIGVFAPLSHITPPTEIVP